MEVSLYDTVRKQSQKIREFLQLIHTYDFSTFDDTEFSEYAAKSRAGFTIKRISAGKAIAEDPKTSAEIFALVKDAFRRSMGIDIYDEQLWAGIVLCEGSVAEMATGEGKTFAAAFPAVINAYSDIHTDIYTFNDYLAKRDAKWLDRKSVV